MKSKDFYAWLHTSDADYYETEQVGDNMVVVTFADIEFPTEEEKATELAIKACEDLLGQPYVSQGNGVDVAGALYEDTAEGLRNAIKLLKGIPL